MPGKYSHSVVLADFSSRGVIVLPEEQRAKYASSSPRPAKSRSPQVRLSGTKSAQASYRLPSTSLEGWDALVAERSYPSLSNHTSPARPRIHVTSDTNQDGTRSKRHSGMYDQIPRSSPAVNVARSPEPMSAYQRQQQLNAFPTSRSVAPSDRSLLSTYHTKATSNTISPQAQLAPYDTRNSTSKTSLGEDAPSGDQQYLSPLISSNGKKRSSLRALSPASSSSALREPSEAGPSHGVPHTASLTNRRKDASSAAQIIPSNRVTPKTLRDPPDANPPRSTALSEVKQPKHVQRQCSSERFDIMARSKSNESQASKHTQIWNPQQDINGEPDFDGFSDTGDVGPGYFDIPARQIDHSRDSSRDSTLPIQRPDTRDKLPSLDGSDYLTPVASPRAASARTSDRNTPSATTVSSNVDSTRWHTSSSSVSSTSMLNGTSTMEMDKRLESTRHAPQGSMNQSWRLPEIQEDNGFSPSIFEDHESETTRFKPDQFEMDTSIGQISSGKDVALDDAASELSAALPPPITRFRDEENEFNSNMAKIFGEGGEYVPKKGSNTIGRQAAKKGKGFFAKLRSRSQSASRF